MLDFPFERALNDSARRVRHPLSGLALRKNTNLEKLEIRFARKRGSRFLFLDIDDLPAYQTGKLLSTPKGYLLLSETSFSKLMIRSHATTDNVFNDCHILDQGRYREPIW
jgi:hypothetical protein